MDSAVAMTTERYSELLGTCRDAGYKANLLTLEVGSRGFIHTDSFDKLYQSSLPPEPNRLPWRRSWYACACYSPTGSGGSATGKSLPPAMLLLTRPHCCLTRPLMCTCLVSPSVHVVHALDCSVFFHNVFIVATYCSRYVHS